MPVSAANDPKQAIGRAPERLNLATRRALVGKFIALEIYTPNNASVRLVCGKAEFHGRVRFCYWRDDGYFIGIAFDARSKWSQEKFKPEHLLDPSEVKPRRTKPLKMSIVYLRPYAETFGAFATTFMALSSQYSTPPSR